MTAIPRALTADDLLAAPDGDRYEFVHGRPVEVDSMSAESDYIGTTIARLLGNHCTTHRLGWVMKTPYRCFPHDPQLVRIPDASVVLAGRFEGDRPPRKGFVTIPPDLAVEVISPNDFYEEVEEKMADYRQAGIRLVWVVSPTARTVLVRRPDGNCTLLDESGELSGEGVLPGFACQVADLFV